jgi:hypothetical protein
MGSKESPLSMQTARRRWWGLGALSVVAFLAHLLAFRGLDWGWPRQPVAPPTAAAVQVRVIDAAPLASLPDVSPATAVPAAPAAAPVVKRVAVHSRPAPQAAPVLMGALAPAPVAAPMPVLDVTLAAAPAVAALTTDAAADSFSLPHYRTQMPPAMLLRYVLQRGVLSGNGELSWRPDGNHYELRLDGRVAGLSVLTQVSAGEFDAAGIAPARFTDQRWRHGTKAANFQRSAGKITFSGPSTEFALREGTQDRLSWMVQLGAIVAAEPHLRGAGAKVAMVVVGANGDESVWAFDCIGAESVMTSAGTVNALKFVRESREPDDTQVHVWIDPLLHYLPVRATQKSGPNDEVFELRLQSVDTNP